LAAGVIAAFTWAIHTFVGTPKIQEPLLDLSLPQSVSLLLFACWHLVTVTLGLSALSLIWTAYPSGGFRAAALPCFISLLWLMFGLVFITIALVEVGTSALFVIPQWVLLIPVGVLGLIGDRQRRMQSAQLPTLGGS